MRVRRKAKDVDTVTAQKLTEVRSGTAPMGNRALLLVGRWTVCLLSLVEQVAGPPTASTSTSAPTSPAFATSGRLPLELYGHIVSQVDIPNALRQICLVCKFFCHEGRRGLYNEVDLPMRRVPPFAWTVVNNPHIARRVRSITITFPSQMVSMSNSHGKDIVAIVLQSLTELENLDIYGQSRIPLQKLLDVTNPRLKRFKSSVYICQEVIDGLAARPGLRELVVPDSYPHFWPVVPEVFLPNLETLCLPMCLVHHITKMNCPLTNLAIDLSSYRGLEYLVPGIISHFGETLRNLSLVRLVPPQAHKLCPTIDLISEFAANVPKLKFLTVSVCEPLVGLKYYQRPHLVPLAHFPRLQPPRYLGRIKNTNWKSFKALETLVWFAEDSVDVARHALAIPMMAQDPVFVGEKFAHAVSGTCAALTRFIFVNESRDFVGYRWGNDGTRSELTDAADVQPYIEPRAWRTI